MELKQNVGQNQQLDQLLVNLVQNRQYPDMREAIKNKKKKSVKQNSKNKLFQGKKSWQYFGPGVNLYFSLLKYLSILFIVLFINATPSLLCNLKGKGLDIYHQKALSHIKIDIMKTSLANLPVATLKSDEQMITTNENKDSDQIYSRTTVHRFIISFNDIYLTAIIIVFFIFWQIKSKQIINQDTKNIDLPSYRTIIVYDIFDESQIPQLAIDQVKTASEEEATDRKLFKNNKHENHSLNLELIWQQKIKEHFQKFGKVDSVTLIYDYGETLRQLTDFNLLVKEFSETQQHNDLQKKNLIYELLKIKFQIIKTDYLIKTKDNVKNYEVPFLPKKAFVTFRSKEDRNRVKKLYKYKVNVQELKFTLNSQDQNIGYQRSLPKTRKCNVEPVSIKWQNFHRKNCQQTKATLLIGGFLCIILLLALVAILLLSIKMAGLIDNITHSQIQPMKVNNDITTTIDTVIEHPTYFQALRSTNVKTLYNFCSSLQLSYSNFHLQYYTLCQEYFTNFTEQSLTMVVLSGLILAINLLLNFIIYSLVDYRRHRTATQKNRFLIVNIFLVYFVNMVVIVLLIRADFDSVYQTSTSLVQLIKVIFPQFQSHKKIQTYSQFNRKWYIHIGNQLIFNYIVSLIICPWLYLFLSWISQRSKFILVRFKRFSKHQAQLNQVLLSQQFDFQTFYAMTLNSFFFCMMFGIGIPLFYLLGAISFFSMYLASQLIFYHFCKVPVPFDHSINKFVSKILVLGLAAHQIIAILFLYVQDIFPEKNNTQSSTNFSKNSIHQKLGAGWIFIVMFFLVVTFYFFKKQIVTIVSKKYFLNANTKQLNQEQIMKQIDVNLQDQINENSIFGQNQMGQNKTIQQYTQKRESLRKRTDFSYINSSPQYYYRMQDNPLYTNIHYTLTVFHEIVYNKQFKASSSQQTQIQNNQKQSKQRQQTLQSYKIIE